MILKLIGSAFLVLVLSGCATIMMIEGNGLSKRVNVPLMNDSVVAIGKLDTNSSKKIGYESVIVLAGEKKSYLFVKGGDKILEIANKFSSSSVLNSYQFTLPKNENLYFDEDVVWGSIVFDYNISDKDQHINETKQELLSLGFKESYHNNFSITIPVEASVKAPTDLKSLNLPKLKLVRDLSFYAPNGKFVEKPNLGTIASLPLTITFDVITSPVQLVGGGILIFVILSQYH